MKLNLAPFNDVDGDGEYSWEAGDYPDYNIKVLMMMLDFMVIRRILFLTIKIFIQNRHDALV